MKARKSSQKIYHHAIAQFDRHSIKTYYKRGKTYLKLKEYTKAIDDFNTVLQLEPEDTKAYLIRVYI